MVIIRMSRNGSKKKPFYKIVVMHNKSARDGKAIEQIGFFNPFLKNESGLQIKIDRVDYWLNVGAKMSDRVHSLVKKLKKKSN